MAQYVGSSGTLMATVLEGTGYAYQSYILDTLSSALLGPIAVLLFVGAVLIVAVRYLLTGKGLNQLLWFVAGPALVSSILLTRTQTSGSLWKFGRADRNQGQVSYEQSKVYERKGVGIAPGVAIPRVSSLFASFNRITSSMTSSIVHAIAGSRGKIDGRFIYRTQLAASMRASNITDSRLQALIQQTLLRGCSSMIESAKQVPAITRRGPRSPLTAFDQALTVQVSLNLAQSEDQLVGVEDRSPLVKELLSELQGTHSNLFAQALALEPERFGDSLGRAPFVSEPVTASNIRFSDKDALPETLSCQQVWNISHLAILHYASQENLKYKEISRSLIGDENSLLNDLTLISPPSGELDEEEILTRRAQMVRVFTRVLASYLLRNELDRPSSGSFIQEYSKRGFSFTSLAAPGESDLSAVERGRNEFNSFTERRGIFTTLASLPYYQGILLYILGALFPIFTMLLLIPNKVKGFMLWFFLWVWAKSWDIGFAVVMLLDDYLFKLFSEQHTTPEELYKIGIADADIASIMWSLRQLDPSFNLGTYYSIIAVALGAIPVVSSLLLMGALRGGANLIVDGAQGLTDTLKGATDAALTQKVADKMRLAGSLSEVRRGNKLFAATKGNYQVDYTQDQAVKPNGARYNYQSGNHLNQGTSETFGEQLMNAEKLGIAGGMLREKGLIGDEISKRLATDSPNPLAGLNTYAEQANKLQRPYQQVAKSVMEQRAKFLEAVATTDFNKRMSLASNEGYRTDEVNSAVGMGMIAKTIVFPMAPKDGDEKAQLDAQLTLHFESIYMDQAEEVAKYALIPTTVKGMIDPFTAKGRGEVSRMDPFRTMNRNRDDRRPTAFNRKPTDYDSYVREAAEKYNVDPDLIFAMMAQESGGVPGAVSTAGAMGLMQLMPGTAKDLGVNDPFDPKQNIDAGVRYFKQMYDQFGTLDKALAAYNAGPGRVQKHDGIPPIKETEDYVRKIKQRYDATKSK